MRIGIWMAALLCLAQPISADPGAATTYKTAEGIQFELPDHWEPLNLAESLIYGAATGYVVESQTRERAKVMLRQTKNIVVATSPRNRMNDSDIFFQINLIPLPDGLSISQDQFKQYSEAERQTFLAGAKASSDVTVRDTNKALDGFGRMRRTALGFTSTDHLHCAKTDFTNDFIDLTSTRSAILFCPIGYEAIVIESSISSAAASEEVVWAEQTVDSVRTSE